MRTFRITVTNQTFSACNDHELPSLSDATRQGVKAALEIGSEEVANGKSYFGAEIHVEENNKTLGKFVVSVGMSPIQ